VANFIILARNLKFYPLSFHNAIAEGAPLAFIADTFKARTCKGEEKLFKNLHTWELLNLRVDAILEIPHRLYNEYQISPAFLDKVMAKYVIQTVGKDALETVEHREDSAILRIQDKALFLAQGSW
jgi:hypothetical protein